MEIRLIDLSIERGEFLSIRALLVQAVTLLNILSADQPSSGVTIWRM